MSNNFYFQEKTSRKNVRLVKRENRPNYYARKYFGKGKYSEKSLYTDDIEEARIKVLEIDFPDKYAPKQKLTATGASFNNQGYTYIPKKPSEIGINAELLFAGRMYDLGYEVYKPHYDVWAADFVVCKDNIYSKVQVKSSAQDDYRVHLRTRDGKRYTDFVDYLAFLSFTEGRMYYIPTDKIPKDANTLSIHLMKKYILCELKCAS